MIATVHSTVELFRPETMEAMLRSPGPCVTMLLPPFRPGEGSGSAATLVKSNLQIAARQLTELGLSKTAVTNLLEPLEHPSFSAGSHWSRAIFCSPGVLQQFDSTQPLKAAVIVAGCFSIKALLAELQRPKAFYVLALSKSRVSLLRCAGLSGEIASLPAGVPETLSESLALEPPDHTLENRSSSGTSAGAMKSVRFGTGSGRERERTHLADFYKLVDRGLQQLLGSETPLILAGVDEDTAMYRGISTSRQLTAGTISGSFHLERDQREILGHAYAILRACGTRRQAAALKSARDRTTPARFSQNAETIVKAAFEGRISELYLNEAAERIDLFERGAYQSWGKEDLLNLAAVQTILRRGKAFALPADLIPGRGIAAAIMRY